MEIKSPFYPIVAQKDKDFDLTIIEGRKNSAKGEPVMIEGYVTDAAGRAVSDVTVELWQAYTSGKYNHPHDSNPALSDPNFQGWVVVPSGKNDGFRFKIVMPGTYLAAADWMRPPHIHIKVSKRGYVELITQMYFSNHPLSAKDLLVLRKSKEDRALMIAEEIHGKLKTFKYRIVIQKS